MAQAAQTCSEPGCRDIIYGYGKTDDEAKRDLEMELQRHVREKHNN